MVILLALIIFIVSLLIPSSISAVTLDILSAPDSISKEEFSVTVQVNGAQVGINYLRIDLYKDGTSNYFGETSNGIEWYGGSEGIKYFPINITEDQVATASIQGRFGNPSNSAYTGTGSYKLRVRRYTSSGNSGSTDQTPKDVQITVTLPSPTSTPDPTPKLDPTPSPKATPKPSATVKPTLKPTPKASIKSSPTQSPDTSGEILSETSSMSPAPTGVEESSKSGSVKFPMGILLVGAGIVLSGGAGFLAYKQNQKQKLI